MKKIKADLIVTDGKLLHLFTPVFVLTFQHEENYWLTYQHYRLHVNTSRFTGKSNTLHFLSTVKTRYPTKILVGNDTA